MNLNRIVNRIMIRIVPVVLMIGMLFAACKKDKIANTGGGDDGGDGNGNPPTLPADFKITPIAQLNQGTEPINSHADVTSRSSLEMDYRSYINLGQADLGVASPNYPRIKRLQNGSFILFFHNNQIGASCDYSLSKDLKTWTPQGKIFKNYSITDSKGAKNERRFSNCNGLVLQNGDIIAVASYRANIGYRELPRDAGIELRRSKDNGITWGDPVDIYQGVNWEPFLLQLPSGEIQCYFTDSDSTLVESAYTGTAMVSSKDGGDVWTPAFGSSPYFVIRTKHEKEGKTYFTDQMPAILKLNNSNELAAALEANVGTYYISLAYSGTDGAWSHLAPDQEGPADRNDNAFLGSGPDLVQFPSGETVLSYNYSSNFYMKLGDTSARHFSQPYAPFTGKGYWGTMELVDSHQLIGAMPNTSGGEVMLSKFILNHQISATQRKVQVNGDNAEWKNTDEALFVGAKSQAQATLRASVDKDSVYFLVEVLDDYLAPEDFTTIYISSNTTTGTLQNKEGYRIRLSYNGLKSSEVFQNNGWVNADLGLHVKAAYHGTGSDNSDKDEGYIVELAVARSKIKIQSANQVLLNFSITDGNQPEDAITDPNTTSKAKWVPLIGL